MKTVKQIPGAMTVVNLATGKETHEPMAWTMLPPAADKCQVCARKHEPGEPHDAQSLYYQTAFTGMMGRLPTWADALAHCDDNTKRVWEAALREGGHWSEPPDGEAPVRHHGL
jgi:ribosomal protein L28